MTRGFKQLSDTVLDQSGIILRSRFVSEKLNVAFQGLSQNCIQKV